MEPIGLAQEGGHHEKGLYHTDGNHILSRKRFLGAGMKVKLVKDPENQYDSEAIRVELPGIGTIRFVANSVNTVLGDSMSAGRLYDRIGKKADAVVEIITDNVVLCGKK